MWASGEKHLKDNFLERDEAAQNKVFDYGYVAVVTSLIFDGFVGKAAGVPLGVAFGVAAGVSAAFAPARIHAKYLVDKHKSTLRKAAFSTNVNKTDFMPK